MTVDQTIEKENRPYTDGEISFVVYEHGIYEDSSVLAGQDKRSFKDSFDSLEEAQEAFPEAHLIEGTTKQNINAMTSHLPDCTPGSYGDPDEAAEYDDEW